MDAKRNMIVSLAIALGMAFASGAADLPHVFGDNMVLQRGQRVPVWGTGEPGEAVTVEGGKLFCSGKPAIFRLT